MKNCGYNATQYYIYSACNARLPDPARLDKARTDQEKRARGILGLLMFTVGQRFFHIADGFLCFASHLLAEAFRFVFLAAGKLAGFFLDFTGKVFRTALDLILIHDWLLWMIPLRIKVPRLLN
ncbi:MAG: hypothetical protein JWQ23_1281 [Herminiimonas sp.]|nr:hypothetical protein [Herminiimonas sp.]